MANGFGRRLGGLLQGGDPVLDLGLGLLSAGAPSTDPRAGSLGAGLASASRFVDERERSRLQNQQQREQLLALRRQREQRAKLEQLIGSAGPQPGQQMPAGESLPPTGGVVPATEPAPMFNERQAALLRMLPPDSATQIIAEREGLLGGSTETPFSKINPAEFTPESIARFQETGDFSQLRPAQDEDDSGLQSKIAEVTQALGRPLNEREILDAAGISAEEAPERIEAEQIPPNQLNSVRLPDGSAPPIGRTWGQAKEAGAKVFSAADLKRKESVEGAMHTINQLERMALDPDTGVFIDEGGSPLTNNVLGRLLSGVSNGFGALAGTEASERRKIFDSTSRGVLSSLVRSLGESGALSDGDVSRAMELMPTLGATPATERQARRQFSELRAIISRGQENLNRMEGGGETIDLGDGFTLRQVR